METSPGTPGEPPQPPTASQSVSEQHDDSDARRRDRRVGLAIIAAAFVVSLGLSLWAKRESEPEQSVPPAPPSSAGMSGFPNRIDPVAQLPRARDLTRRSVFKGFVAEGVASDGTIDVAAGQGSVVYAFESPRGHGPQPPRQPGLVPRRDLCGRQKVRIDRRGISADNDQAGLPCLPTAAESLPAPRCGLADIWREAQKRGATSSQRARIEYYRAPVGPAYRFELADGSARFALYGDCRRVLTPSESIGSSQ